MNLFFAVWFVFYDLEKYLTVLALFSVRYGDEKVY